uniref:Titin n=1 Tax=Sander lucioperca TaxID=283035 RepID=A0A8C9Z8D1_SANLU
MSINSECRLRTDMERVLPLSLPLLLLSIHSVCLLPQNTGEITAKDEIEAPEVTMDSKFKDLTVVSAGETFVIDADFTGKPLPEVTWIKDGKEIDKTTPRMEVKTTLTRTILTVKECVRVDGGHFVLKLVNVGGVKMIPVNVKVLDRPGPPDGPLEVKGVTAEKCYLHWSHPSHDGGASISHYIIEKRETSRLSWTVVEPKIQAISYKITKLLPGNEYIFRSLESEPVIARNPFTTPSAPSTPEPSAITRDSIVLTWERPEHNGGAELEGYILEKRDKDGIRWTKCNKKRLSDLRFRCTGLTEGHSYEFRISAENAAGVGKPSAPTGYIKACDAIYPPGPPNNAKVTGHSIKHLKENAEYNFRIFAFNCEGVGEHLDLPGSVIAAEKLEAPEIELDADLRKMVNVRASATLRLFVTIRGKPEPEVRWSKADGTLNERAQIEVTSSYTMLVIENVDRFDTGKYVLTLENLSGSKSAFINVRVLDSPSTPTNLVVKDVKRTSVSLSWEPPLIDGGAKISHYIVEQREQKRMAFTSVCTNCVRNSYIISDLQEGGRYYFRVLAVNELGVGLPASTDQVKVAEAPLPPGKVVLVDVTRHTVTLSWEKPDHDGGSKITNFIVEMQPKGDDKWTVCSEVKALEATIGGLTSGEEYSFRVFAVNDKGKSDAKPLATPVVVKDITVEPTINLLYDTYSITGYIVERKELPDGRWLKCNFTNLQDTYFDVTGLTEDVQYDFHVIAKNSAELLSAPSESTGPVTVKDDVDPPTIIMEDKFRQLVVVKAGEIIQIDAEITGRPLPVVSWSKDGKEIEAKARCEITSTNFATTLIVRDAIRRDSGQYVLTLHNVAGTRSVAVNCKVLDRPGPSSGPMTVSGLTAEKCTITWGPPQENGGAEIMHYIVEKRETSRLAWTLVYGDMKATTCKVTKLLKGNEYILRVRGVNKYGEGEALESEPIKLGVTDVTKESVSLAWAKPEHDGGSRITGYLVEALEKGQEKWVKCGVTKFIHLTVSGLRENAEYFFRVRAENHAGFSDIKEMITPVVVKDQLGKLQIRLIRFNNVISED